MRLRQRGGFALIAVLWVLVFLGALALDFHAVGRADRQVAANARSAARARWAARAGLSRTLAALDRLLASDFAVRALASAGDTLLPPLRLHQEGMPVTSIARDARARLHLNWAGASELRSLLEAIGYPQREAEALAHAVLEWRGGRVAASGHAGRPVGPGPGHPFAPPVQGAFSAVSDLRAVPGFTPSVYGRVAPHLTVASDGRINVNSAAVPVLSTLPGMDLDGARAVVERRRRAALSNQFELLDALPRATRDRVQSSMAALNDRLAFSPRELEIEVLAQPAGSPMRVRLQAVVRLEGGARLSLQQWSER